MIAEEFITLLQAKNGPNNAQGWHDLRLQEDLVKAISNMAERQDSPSKRKVLTQLKEYTGEKISKSEDESDNKYAGLVVTTQKESAAHQQNKERPKSSPAHSGKPRPDRRNNGVDSRAAASAAQANNAYDAAVPSVHNVANQNTLDEDGHMSVYLPRPDSRRERRRPSSAKPRSRSSSPQDQHLLSGFTHQEATGESQAARHKRLRRSISALPADNHMRLHRAKMRTIGGF